MAEFALDALQCRLPLLVDRRELEGELEPRPEPKWLRRGCRLRVLEEEEGEGEEVCVELRAR